MVDLEEILKKYAERIKICGNDRNSYSKTDHDATFMRMKRDHMGNDQLLPGYNIQCAVCDIEPDKQGRIAIAPALREYAGLTSEVVVVGMEKYMKFTMYEKESKNEKYRNDPYRAVNFPVNESGLPVCPNRKEFHFIYSRPVKGNKYGRTEEYFQCEDCSGCPHKEKCCKCKENRIVRLNEELTQFHAEVLNNLNSIHGALLRMNRNIQSEGTFGTIKWNRSYIRARRRGLKSLFLEFGMIFCGFNLHKFHLKKVALRSAA